MNAKNMLDHYFTNSLIKNNFTYSISTTAAIENFLEETVCGAKIDDGFAIIYRGLCDLHSQLNHRIFDNSTDVNYNTVSQPVSESTPKKNIIFTQYLNGNIGDTTSLSLLLNTDVRKGDVKMDETEILALNIYVLDFLNLCVKNSEFRSKLFSCDDVLLPPCNFNCNICVRSYEFSQPNVFVFLYKNSRKMHRIDHWVVSEIFKPNLSVNQNNPNKSNVKSNSESPSSMRKFTDYFPIHRSARKTKREQLKHKQQLVEKAIVAGKKEGLKIHNFVGKGRGVMTTRPFSKGEFVVEYSGELISFTAAKAREKLYAQDENIGSYMYYFKHKDKMCCVDSTPDNKTLGRLINHSRRGNLVTKIVCVNDWPRLIFFAKEYIPRGTEVLYDYGERRKDSLRHNPWLKT